MDELREFLGPLNGQRIASRLESMTTFLGEFPDVDLRKETIQSEQKG
jgi:hypothetical protein